MSLLSKHLLPRTAFIVALSVDTVALHSVTIGQSNLGAPIKVSPRGFAEEIEDAANQENYERGIGRQQLAAFEGGVMFGWDSPAADPRSYDHNGDALAFQRQLKAA